MGSRARRAPCGIRPLIDLAQVTKAAARDGVTAQVVERDYVLSHVLSGLYSMDETDRIIFKGGTALRACYFEEYRYSADLDFSLIEGMSVGQALQKLEAALRVCVEEAAFAELQLLTRPTPRISYTGPLGKSRPIKLDLADDELVEEPTSKPLIGRYMDLPKLGEIPVYTLTEVAAEKLRCLLQRVLCRDVFDLHYALETGRIVVAECWEVFERKAAHRGKDPAALLARLDELEGRLRAPWREELSDYMQDPPDFETVWRELRRQLRPHLRG